MGVDAYEKGPRHIPESSVFIDGPADGQDVVLIEAVL
jgi:hypothetical protein